MNLSAPRPEALPGKKRLLDEAKYETFQRLVFNVSFSSVDIVLTVTGCIQGAGMKVADQGTECAGPLVPSDKLAASNLFSVLLGVGTLLSSAALATRGPSLKCNETIEHGDGWCRAAAEI